MRKFIFIHIPKNAGQSMKKVLCSFNAFCNGRCTIPAKEHIAKIGIKKFRSHFSFTFVRNPWDRQVSLYKFIHKTPSHYLHSTVIKLTFEEYIRIGLPDWSMINESQTSYIFVDDKLAVDFVGRFENLQEDFQKVCNVIGIEGILPKLNSTEHNDYQHYYNDKTMEIVKNIFEKDIIKFGYKYGD